MPSVIKARTFTSVLDSRIQLSNSNCARLWHASIGTTWTKIRVGARISITDSGADISGSPRFRFGIQSGTTNMFLDAGGPTHWCGFSSNSASSTRGTTSGVASYNLAADGGVPAKKVATTITTGSNFNTIAPLVGDSAQPFRSLFFLDITKGSPNFTFEPKLIRSNTLGLNDVSLTDFLAQMVLASPSFVNHGYGGSVTLAIDEAANGYFNAVGFAWDRPEALIELSDVMVVKFS